ncbi:mCG1034463 [Mus musculus]|nr:mCG1034463 [Mus musculus]
MHLGGGGGRAAPATGRGLGAEMTLQGWGASRWLPPSFCLASVVWAGSQASSALSPEGSWPLLRTGTYFSLKWL